MQRQLFATSPAVLPRKVNSSPTRGNETLYTTSRSAVPLRHRKESSPVPLRVTGASPAPVYRAERSPVPLRSAQGSPPLQLLDEGSHLNLSLTALESHFDAVSRSSPPVPHNHRPETSLNSSWSVDQSPGPGSQPGQYASATKSASGSGRRLPGVLVLHSATSYARPTLCPVLTMRMLILPGSVHSDRRSSIRFAGSPPGPFSEHWHCHWPVCNPRFTQRRFQVAPRSR